MQCACPLPLCPPPQCDNLTLQLPAGTTTATITDSWDGGHTSVELSPPAAGTPEEAAPSPIPAIVAEAPATAAPIAEIEQQVAAVEEEEEEEEEVVAAVGSSAAPSSNILPGPIGSKAPERKPVAVVAEEDMAELN